MSPIVTMKKMASSAMEPPKGPVCSHYHDSGAAYRFDLLQRGTSLVRGRHHFSSRGLAKNFVGAGYRESDTERCDGGAPGLPSSERFSPKLRLWRTL